MSIILCIFVCNTYSDIVILVIYLRYGIMYSQLFELRYGTQDVRIFGACLGVVCMVRIFLAYIVEF